MRLKSFASAPLDVTRSERILQTVEFACPIILVRGQNREDPEVKAGDPAGISHFASPVNGINRNIRIGSQRLIPGIKPVPSDSFPVAGADFTQNIPVNSRKLLFTESQLVEPGWPDVAKLRQYRRVDVKEESDTARLQSSGEITDQVAPRCPSWMNGFPGLDGGGAVRMRMVQGENDVTRSHLLDHIRKSVDVESIDRIFIRLLLALSGLGEVRPMKHHPVTRLYKPIGIRSMGADTFFRRNDCGTARDGNNLQASEANHSTLLWSGYLDGDRVYSPSQM